MITKERIILLTGFLIFLFFGFYIAEKKFAAPEQDNIIFKNSKGNQSNNSNISLTKNSIDKEKYDSQVNQSKNSHISSNQTKISVDRDNYNNNQSQNEFNKSNIIAINKLEEIENKKNQLKTNLIFKKQNNITVAISEMPLTFNPFMSRRYIEKVITGIIYSSILTIKYPTGKPEEEYPPELVKAIEVSHDDQSIINMVIKDNISTHKNTNITIDDIHYSISAINEIESNDYHLNNISLYNEKNNAFSLQINYPKYYDGKRLYQYLTFHIVPKGFLNNISSLINTNTEIQKQIVGSGPYSFEIYDENSNKIMLKRFANYINNSLQIANPISKIEFHFRDKYKDIINSFEKKEFQILLDHFGTPPLMNTPIVNKVDPALNSFTCLAFNFRPNPFIELINNTLFREIVASCMNKKVRQIFNVYPGKSMYLLDEPQDRTALNKVYKHDLKKAVDIKKMIDTLFEGETIKKFMDKSINIYYQGYKPVYERLADQIARNLKEYFGYYLSFNPKPLSSPKEWNDMVNIDRDFSLLLYTYYFGFGEKRIINNMLFFDLKNDRFNITGYPIEYQNNYERYLLKVNEDIPVVVLGRFIRTNYINNVAFITPWNDPNIPECEREALKCTPLFYNVWEWYWK